MADMPFYQGVSLSGIPNLLKVTPKKPNKINP